LLHLARSAVCENGFLETVRVWDVNLKSYDFEGGIMVGVMFGNVPHRGNFECENDIWGEEGGKHLGQLQHCLALSSDGTLYKDGEKLKGNYGTQKLKGLKAGDVINVVLDLDNYTLSFGLNSEPLGIAFTSDSFPSSSPNPQPFFPAVSLKSYNDHITLTPAGLGNTTISLYWMLSIEKALAHLGGKLASTLIAGPSVSIEETEHEKWLRSPMIIGGLERNEEISENWMIDVAEETSQGMSLLLGDVQEVKSRSNTLLGDTLSFTTGEQIKAWIDEDVIEDDNVFEMPPQPDLVIRDKVSLAKGKAGSICDSFVPLHSLCSNPFSQSQILDELAISPRTQTGEKFYEWMEGHVGEPLFLKKRLDANGCYSFPFCEQPFIAALLKHSGMWREVMWLISSSARHNSEISRAPSDNMRFLFGKVKTLRGFLRRKRQLFLSEGDKSRFEELCWGVRDRGEFLRGTKVHEGNPNNPNSPDRPGLDSGGGR
jgi:hypothetical protein